MSVVPQHIEPFKKQLYKIRPRSIARGLNATTAWLMIRKYTPPAMMSEGEHGESVVIPEAMGRSQRGYVVSVAPGIDDVKEGDLVIYTNFPMEIEDVEDLTGEKDVQLINNEEVYAVCEPTETVDVRIGFTGPI